MEAAGQPFPNEDTAKLYQALIAEELKELVDAETDEEELDAILDTIWVFIGYALAKGWLVRSAWEEVVRSNMSKIPENGRMLKREDGKFLKPPGYSAPDLTPFVKG
jgi:predicted HAD superfamily Cof-like phosphohydrolase